MLKHHNRTKAAVLALLLTQTSAENVQQQSLTNIGVRMLSDEKQTTHSLVNQGLIAELDEDMSLNSLAGSYEEDAMATTSFVQVEQQIRNAVQEEKMAEQKALSAEQQMRSATNKKERKTAKKQLMKAQSDLKLAEQKLEQVQKTFAQVNANQKDNESESESESSDDNKEENHQSLSQQTASIDLAEEIKERTNMKEFFKKSTVYKNFKAEEDKELLDRQDYLETEDEIQDYHDKYESLQQQFKSLEQIMFAQKNASKKTEPTAEEVAKEIQKMSHVKEPLMHTVPAPSDKQYEQPQQMRKPLIPENQTDKDDLRNVYNPNKYQNNIGNYNKKDNNKEAAKLTQSKNNTNQAVQMPTQTNVTSNSSKTAEKKALVQINPTHPTGLEPPPPDHQYDVPAQLRHPLTRENQVDENDIQHHYNPLKHLNHVGNYSQDKKKSTIDPNHPTGLEPAPKDQQYDVPAQMKKPLIFENRTDANDIRNIYNPDKYNNDLGNYSQSKNSTLIRDVKKENKKALAQVNPSQPTGLEPAPKDWQYDVVHQMKKPLTWENRDEANDVRNIYNPNKYEHTLGEYVQTSIETDDVQQVSKEAKNKNLKDQKQQNNTKLSQEDPPEAGAAEAEDDDDSESTDSDEELGACPVDDPKCDEDDDDSDDEGDGEEGDDYDDEDDDDDDDEEDGDGQQEAQQNTQTTAQQSNKNNKKLMKQPPNKVIEIKIITEDKPALSKPQQSNSTTSISQVNSNNSKNENQSMVHIKQPTVQQKTQQTTVKQNEKNKTEDLKNQVEQKKTAQSTPEQKKIEQPKNVAVQNQADSENLDHVTHINIEEIKRLIAQNNPQEAKKPVEQNKPGEIKKPVEQKKPEEIKKPVEQKKPEEIKKPAEQKKPEEIKKPAEQKKQEEIKKPIELKKQEEIKKPAEQKKQEEIRKPVESKKPEEKKMPIEQKKPVQIQNPVEQKKPVEIKKPEQIQIPNEQQKVEEIKKPIKQKKNENDDNKIMHINVEEIKKLIAQNQTAEAKKPVEQKKSEDVKKPIQQNKSLEISKPVVQQKVVDIKNNIQQNSIDLQKKTVERKQLEELTNKFLELQKVLQTNEAKKQEQKALKMIPQTLSEKNTNQINKQKKRVDQVDKGAKKVLAQINPAAPTGLEPAPKDWQYDVPHQMKKPLIFENRVDANDLRNIYNPNKYEHTLGEYAQLKSKQNFNENENPQMKSAVKSGNNQIKKEAQTLTQIRQNQSNKSDSNQKSSIKNKIEQSIKK